MNHMWHEFLSKDTGHAWYTIMHDCHGSRDTHGHCLNFEKHCSIYPEPQRRDWLSILRSR